MVFWLAILAGGLFAWLAIKMGFYVTWAMLFNIVISVYLAVFLTPIIVEVVPGFGDTSYGIALTLIAAAVGTFLILHCISYTFLTGQFNVSFPKIFDMLLAGLLGFLAGFLVLSFAAFLICVMPISQNRFVSGVGFNRDSQQANISYICRWCDFVNWIVSSGDDEATSERAINQLLGSAKPRARPKTARPAKPGKPVKPKDVTADVNDANSTAAPPAPTPEEP